MKRLIVILALIVIASSAFTIIDKYVFEVPKGWPQPEYDFKSNPLTRQKIELGRVLFYDPILSKNYAISCASCHSPYNAFAHVDHELSHGIFDSIGKRNAPALMNLAWQRSFMWDGAVKNLNQQALTPITHPKEMGEDMDNVIRKLQASTFYSDLFFTAYGDHNITKEKVLKSMAQFLVSLVSANAKYDSVRRGQTQFTNQEKNGYHLFRSHCASCHKEPLFTDGSLKNNGLPVNSQLKDYGLMGVTHNKKDSFYFKVPTLRNIEYSFPYMHDGRFRKLSEVINHYVSGIQKSHLLSKELKHSIELTSNEKVDLISFLLTLSDKSFVFNSDFQFPRILLNNNKQ